MTTTKPRRFVTFLQRLGCLICALLVLTTAPAAAMSQDQRNALGEGIGYFDPDDASLCTTDGAATSSMVSLPANATPEYKIAQTFVLGFDAGTPKDTIKKVFADTHAGGLYLTGTKDAAGAGFTKDFYSQLSAAAGTPVLATSDEEGGQILRYKYTSNFPSAKEMGAKTAAEITAIGKSVGQEMANNGITVDLAPVLDLDNGQNNGSISKWGRAFSSDPAKVATAADAFASGLQQAGVTPVLKHFPGLGRATPDSDTDTHKATSPPIADLNAKDLLPYKSLLGKYNAAVMLSNEYVQGVDTNNPAGESAAVVNLLRQDYNFNGLITTDDLAAAHNYDGTASLAATVAASMKAGVNMPLFKFTSEADVTAAIAAVKAALSSDQIQTSVDKVLALKGNNNPGNIAPTGGSGAGCCPTDASLANIPNAPGRDYVPDAFKYLTSKGLSGAAAAGVIGNLMWESGSPKLDPTAVEKGNGSAPTPGVGYGIAQWTDAGRQKGLLDYAKKNNLDFRSFTAQIGWLWEEASTRYPTVIAHIKAATDPRQAAQTWMLEYERPGNPHLQERQDYAAQVMGRMNGGNIAATGTTSTASCNDGSAGFTATPGKDSAIIDCPSNSAIKCTKSIYYSQWDGPWKNTPFGAGCGSIGECGCGLTSAAMAIATLTNNPGVNPTTLLPIWQANGLSTSGGTSWSTSGWAAVGNKYGLKISQITAHGSLGMSQAEVQSIIAAINGGALVGVSGKDVSSKGNDANSSSPFTPGGHFILLRGYDSATKKFLISDPNNSLSGLNTTKVEWGWNILTSYGESAWKISK